MFFIFFDFAGRFPVHNFTILAIFKGSKLIWQNFGKFCGVPAIKLGKFSDLWQRAVHQRQKLKNLLKENLSCFSFFGSVLCTAAKTRQKMFKKLSK